MRVLIRFSHGLGDAVQFGIVLRHLRVYRPDWQIDVQSLHGKHSAMHGYCQTSFSDRGQQPNESEYDQILNISWPECHRPFSGVPSTKASLCLQEVFGINPDPALCRYEMRPDAILLEKTRHYLQRISNAEPDESGKFPVVAIHYQGNTSVDKKNLDHEFAIYLCDRVLAAGFVPMVLDWDARSPIPDGSKIHCPSPGPGDLWGNFGSGDAQTLWCLIEQCRLMVGIDSGPLHIAGATSTPTIGVWTGHHPLKYFDFADNVIHSLPREDVMPLSHDQAVTFAKHYNIRRRTQQQSRTLDVAQLAGELLGKDLNVMRDENLVLCNGFWIRRDNIDQDLVIVNDVHKGDAYKTHLLPGVINEAKIVVDIGAHIGTFAKLIHEQNPTAKIICVEACPENLDALRANVGAFAEVVHAACSYEAGELGLLNAVRSHCESTGGSEVVSIATLAACDPLKNDYRYWKDFRPLRKVTLEDLGAEFGFEEIDLLKLDCESSEFSILANSTLVDRTRMIVGEYHGEDRWNDFRQHRFHAEHWDYGLMFSDGAGRNGLFHLANKNWKAIVTIAVPPGIGDSLWAVAKIQGLLRSHPGARRARIGICEGNPRRSKEFLERFDFVESVSYTPWSCVESEGLCPDGTINYAQTGTGWHNEFDWILVPNRTLERGERLESWQPQWEVNWNVMDHWRFTGKEFSTAVNLRKRLGDYAVFYASSAKNNSVEGHNRNGIWAISDWKRLVDGISQLGIRTVLLGAEYDADYATALSDAGVSFDECAVGKFSIGETLAAIRMSRLGVYYQSGLGVAAAYMGVPTAMWWRQHGDSISPDAYLSFNEKMATSWVSPCVLERGAYMPLYYGRESADDIVEQIVSRGW